MMGGGTTGQEKVAIQAIQGDGTLGTVTAWAKSTGGGDVTISEAILKDSAGNVVVVDNAVAGPVLPADGAMQALTCSFTGMAVGDLYTVTLVSQLGNQYVSSTFKAS